MTSSIWVKICGVMTATDALMVRKAGADAIGLNFALGSPRCLSLENAESVVNAVRNHESAPSAEHGRADIEWVGVFVNRTFDDVRQYAQRLQLDWVQLHGDEDAQFRRSLGLPAYHAARIAEAEDMNDALSLGGSRLLVDAKVKGAYGGTGEKFDWSLLEGRPPELELILAGGLRPDNIAQAISAVRPFGVDTASGVESSPGVKERSLVEAFVARARTA